MEEKQRMVHLYCESFNDVSFSSTLRQDIKPVDGYLSYLSLKFQLPRLVVKYTGASVLFDRSNIWAVYANGIAMLMPTVRIYIDNKLIQTTTPLVNYLYHELHKQGSHYPYSESGFLSTEQRGCNAQQGTQSFSIPIPLEKAILEAYLEERVIRVEIDICSQEQAVHTSPFVTVQQDIRFQLSLYVAARTHKTECVPNPCPHFVHDRVSCSALKVQGADGFHLCKEQGRAPWNFESIGSMFLNSDRSTNLANYFSTIYPYHLFGRTTRKRTVYTVPPCDVVEFDSETKDLSVIHWTGCHEDESVVNLF
jgi:hypothetical protein